MILPILLFVAFLIILIIYFKKDKQKDCALNGIAVKKGIINKKIKK